MTAVTLKSPFPYFGGKSKVAHMVWDRFGDVVNYVEPFAGSLAVLLARPHPFKGTETCNDACGFIANFWRAVQSDPDAVANHADHLIHECDLHARHAWLVGRKDSLQAKLEGDPDYFDAKSAGRWLYGICLWIGSGWCSGDGPWQVVEAEDGSRQLVHLGNAGMGVNRQLVHLGNAGRGVNRQLVHLGDAGRGQDDDDAGGEPQSRGACEEWSAHIRATMRALADRLRRVRVCCGDWSRVCGPTPTVKMGLTAVFLDPPYADTADRQEGLYRRDSLDVAHAVRAWALAHGDDPMLRICLCGYEDEHVMPATWGWVRWKSKGGYGSQGDGRGRANAEKECLWFSPHCLKPGDELPLFARRGAGTDTEGSTP